MVVTDTDGSATGDGALCMTYNSATNPALFTYPIGDTNGTTEYSRVTLDWGNTTYTNFVPCARVTDVVQPNKPPFSPNWITRYWTLTSTGTASTFSTLARFYYVQADVTANENALLYHSWSPSAWTKHPAATYDRGATDGTNNWFQDTLTGFSDHTMFEPSPTAVTLDNLEAAQAAAPGKIDVTWTTAQEIGNLGFNLWRGTTPAGPDVKLNAVIIPSQGPDSNTGFDYVYPDSDEFVAGTTYYYWLEDIALNGTVTRHEPVSVTYLGPLAVGLGSLGGSSALPAALPFAAVGLALVAGAAVWARRRAVR